VDGIARGPRVGVRRVVAGLSEMVEQIGHLRGNEPAVLELP
jgi:hypothetical protein